jgi:hypothetical protein
MEGDDEAPLPSTQCESNQVKAMCFDITVLNKGRIKSAPASLVGKKPVLKKIEGPAAPLDLCQFGGLYKGPRGS